MTEKNIFANFLLLNIWDFSLYFYVKTATPLKKVTPSFPATPLLIGILSSPLFLKNWSEAQPLSPHQQKGGVHTLQTYCLSLRYALHMLLFGTVWVLICLKSPKSFQNFSKDFKIHQLRKKSSYKMTSSNLKYITNVKQNFIIITFLKNICLLVYPSKLMSDLVKQKISDFLSRSSF